MNIEIKALQVADRAAWEPLARGYKLFYDTATSEAEYAAAWRRLLHDPRFLGLAAWRGGTMVGIVHALFHASTWADEVCYLQDLFVAEGARKLGLGRALIEAVYREAQAAGASRVYWNTHETNATARALYDTLADRPGFIQYRKVL